MLAYRRYAGAMSALTLVLGLAAAAATGGGQARERGKMTVYIGTYTGPKSKGIYRCDLDLATGELSTPVLAAECASPSFLAVDPSGRYLYAVNETGDSGGPKSGSVTAYSMEPATGDLGLINHQPSNGTYPCHVSVDRGGRTVLVANYGNGTVAAYPVAPDGGLANASVVIQHQGSGPDRGRQEGPHAHAIYPSPTSPHALAADLGTDEVIVYGLSGQAGGLTAAPIGAAKMRPGSGPRHLAFGADGKFVYVINEMASTITTCRFDAKTGSLAPDDTVSMLPEDFRGASTTAEIVMHPSGKFLYGSNRGHDSIAVFAVDRKTGRLTARGHVLSGGKTPRSFAIDPSGRLLLAANQESDNITVFRVDQRTGRLTPAGHVAAVGAPVCVVIVPQAK